MTSIQGHQREDAYQAIQWFVDLSSDFGEAIKDWRSSFNVKFGLIDEEDAQFERRINLLPLAWLTEPDSVNTCAAKNSNKAQDSLHYAASHLTSLHVLEINSKIDDQTLDCTFGQDRCNARIQLARGDFAQKLPKSVCGFVVPYEGRLYLEESYCAIPDEARNALLTVRKEFAYTDWAALSYRLVSSKSNYPNTDFKSILKKLLPTYPNRTQQLGEIRA